MAQQTPAIARDYNDDDRELEVLRTPFDGINHTRGLGDSGYRVEVVDFACPACIFDRMIRRVDVSPVAPAEVRYWCLYPNCPYFVRDALSHACKESYPQGGRRTPAVMEKP